MDEGHYDMPWEFKNRAIAVALSKSTNSGNELIKPSTSSDENIACENGANYNASRRLSCSYLMSENFADPLKNSKHFSNQNLIVSKRLPNSKIINSNLSNKNEQKSDKFALHNVYADDPLHNANFVRTNRSPLIISNPSTCAKQNETKAIGSNYERRRFSINSSNHQHENNFIKQNGFSNSDAAPFNLSPQMQTFLQNQAPINHRNRLSFDEFDVKKNVSKLKDSEHFNTPSTSSSSSDSPFSPANCLSKHHLPKNKTTVINNLGKFVETYPLISKNCVVSKSDKCDCVLSQNSNNRTNPTKNRLNLYDNQQTKKINDETIQNQPSIASNQQRRLNDESNIIHERMERVEAERLLKPMEVGDFLLRKRNEGNLALSLRSIEGILHIKLEMRDGYWVLGEGPRFPSINGMLRCYKRTELPVRGAEHVRLGNSISIKDIQFLTKQKTNL